MIALSPHASEMAAKFSRIASNLGEITTAYLRTVDHW